MERQVLSHYNATIWKDLFPQEDSFPVKAWGAAWDISTPSDAEVSVLQQKMRDITWTYVPKAIPALPSDFDSVWSDYVSRLKAASVDKMDQEYSKYLKARVALWNE